VLLACIFLFTVLFLAADFDVFGFSLLVDDVVGFRMILK
jgi:hypothetical protein